MGKAVSLWQPWASLLVAGVKHFETRSRPWQTGRYWIHAAKKWDSKLLAMCLQEPFRSHLEKLDGFIGAVPNVPFGAIIGSVEVVRCVKTEDVKFGSPGSDYSAIPWEGGWQAPEHEKYLGDYTRGRYAIVCLNPVKLTTPVPWSGHQGFWEVDDKYIEEAQK